MPELENPETLASQSYEIQKIMYDYYTGYLFNNRSVDLLRDLVAQCNELADQENESIRFEALMLQLQFAEDLDEEQGVKVWTEAVERLIQGHANDPRICRVLEDYSILSPALRQQADEYSKRILKRTDNPAVTANCKYAHLAQYMVKQQYAGGLTPDERKTAIDGLRELHDVHGHEANANSRLHFGTTLADVARGDIFELEHLRIGAVAPEIEALDMDGVPFRLSDYRGKTVMLHFWGDW
ncbi:MAG TPA: hypothetical protein VN669_10310 [Candidatus Acidoferrales bacterium]|jgi:hypothetical protein|nr:hypothetical protein [Candidatus Acidoferrales bacterium]